MKKLLCILLMLMLTLPVLAESAVGQGYLLQIPEGVATESNESSVTFVDGMSRVVAIRIERVPDVDPDAAILRMMAQFAADAVIVKAVPVAEGFTAVQAVEVDAFGAGVDLQIVMVLSQTGELLILSGYDMAGDEDRVQALLDTVMKHVMVGGQPVLITEE